MQQAPARTRPRRSVVPVVAVLAAFALLVVGCSDDDNQAQAPSEQQSSTTTSTGGADIKGLDALDGLPDLVDQVIPSVVAIRTETGEGSGVIWDDQGHIVTNNHVIDGASSITAVLATGTELQAQLLGTDPLTDLALLLVDQQDLPAIERAADTPPEGTAVLALGNPLGFENSVSLGVVSGLRRSIPGGAPSLVDLMQTDAAISPGNSGGALVNLDGQLVGITVAYIPPSQRAVSIGFAVPISTANFVVEQLLASGKVDHAYLGVSLATVTSSLAQRFDLTVDRGAVVQTVVDGSPAAAAGLRAGDIVVAIGSQDVTTAEDAIAAVRDSAPGDTIELKIAPYGGGDERTVSVTLTERPTG